MFLVLVRRVVFSILALLCPAVALHSFILARADWLRTHPSESSVDQAIRLDRMNPYAYTLKAELFEQAGNFERAEQTWRDAIQRNRRDAEAWIRIALLAEHRGQLNEAEDSLLKAAQVSRTWLPRWSLVNFYLRHERKEEAYRWARLALERASVDASALFPILDRSGAPRDFVLNELVPPNRNVVAAYVRYQLAHQLDTGMEEGARRLASLIPASAPGWPGAYLELRPQRTYPADPRERSTLIAVVNRLMDRGDGVAAVRLWNLLEQRDIVDGDRWTAESPVTNASFRFVPNKGGLDWMPGAAPGVLIRCAPEIGEIGVYLDGRQPERVDLITQRVYIPAGMAYRLVVESQTDGLNEYNGLEWQLRDVAGQNISVAAVRPSEDWCRVQAEVAAVPEDRVARLVLSCRRVRGAVRAEGSVRFRMVALEAAR